MLYGKRIAVVLPAYNAARTLEKTVQEIPKDIRHGLRQYYRTAGSTNEKQPKGKSGKLLSRSANKLLTDTCRF